MPPSGGATHVLFEQYWVKAGPRPLPEADAPDDFVVTPSVRRHLATLARAVLLRRHPILLQVRHMRQLMEYPRLRARRTWLCEEETHHQLRLTAGAKPVITKTGPCW